MPSSEPLRPRPRRLALFWSPLFFLTALTVPLVLVPNNLTDLVFSRVCSGLSGCSVALEGVRYTFPSGAVFDRAEIRTPSSSGPVRLSVGQASYLPSKGRFFFQINEIDLRPYWMGANSASEQFIRKHDLAQWLVVKDSRWVLTREGEEIYCLRLLRGEKNGNLLKGGLKFEAGRLSKINTVFCLASSVWERFPNLVSKRFSRDEEGRRLFKVSWGQGLWRLWGRNGPVLEARWQ